MVDEAKRLIFLGFGFWRENLDLLYTGPFNGMIDPSEYNTRSVLRSPEDWLHKRIFASRFKLWRSVFIEVNERIGQLHTLEGPPRPFINWGTDDQTLWDFVTHWNLKA
jgi:hypothetical protein